MKSSGPWHKIPIHRHSLGCDLRQDNKARRWTNLSLLSQGTYAIRSSALIYFKGSTCSTVPWKFGWNMENMLTLDTMDRISLRSAQNRPWFGAAAVLREPRRHAANATWGHMFSTESQTWKVQIVPVQPTDPNWKCDKFPQATSDKDDTETTLTWKDVTLRSNGARWSCRAYHAANKAGSQHRGVQMKLVDFCRSIW